MLLFPNLGRLCAGLFASAVLGLLPLSGQSSLPALPATSVFQNVPEAAEYGIVYELNIPNQATYNYTAVAYAQNHSGQVPDGSFTRIAYAVELNTTTNPANTRWVWVSFDRSSNIVSATKIGVPAKPTGVTYHYPNGTKGDTVIANMNVFSNVAGVATGKAITTGNIEFWPGDYSPSNVFGVPGANDGNYDFGDSPVGYEARNYGSMQMNNYGARQTIFAINNWGSTGGSIDLGIGNQAILHPDWTFARNAHLHVVKRLYVLVKMPAPVITSATSVTADYGTAFSYTITATNSPTSFGASPLLPGLTFNTTTGVISGTLPSTVGTSAIGLSATNTNGTGTSFLEITTRDLVGPAITAPSIIIAEATSAAGAAVTFSATAVDAISGTVLVSASPASGSVFPLGMTSAALSATDGAGNSTTKSILVHVVDTTAPVLTLPASMTVEATSPLGAVATFAVSATDAVGVTSITYSNAPGSTFPIGVSAVAVTAKDAAGNTTTDSFLITVRDTTAPVISSLTTNVLTLWPANHKLVAITLSATATDATGVTSLKIIGATSSEPDNGLGDGDTAGDIEITGDLNLKLRAERSGQGNGRTYTVTVEARDAHGHATTRTIAITVPKSQGGR